MKCFRRLYPVYALSFWAIPLCGKAIAQENAPPAIDAPVSDVAAKTIKPFSQQDSDRVALEFAKLLGRERVVTAPYADPTLQIKNPHLVNGSYYNDGLLIQLDTKRGKLWQIEDRYSMANMDKAHARGQTYTITRKEQAIAITEKINRDMGGLEGDYRVAWAEFVESHDYPKPGAPYWSIQMYRYAGGFPSRSDIVDAFINPYDGSVMEWQGPKTMNYIGPISPSITVGDAGLAVQRAYGREATASHGFLDPASGLSAPSWTPVAPKSLMLRLAYCFTFPDAVDSNDRDFSIHVDATTGEIWTLPERRVVGINDTPSPKPPVVVEKVVSPRMALLARLLAKASPEQAALGNAVLTASEKRHSGALPTGQWVNYRLEGQDFLLSVDKGRLLWPNRATPGKPDSTGWSEIALSVSDCQHLQQWFDGLTAPPSSAKAAANP